jgi:RNA polymerase sigma-70 factor, ECF subfamily
MDDREIINRVVDGHARDFARLVDRYENMVYRVAVRMTGSRVDAEDISQEVFLSAFRRLADFGGNAKFSTWLYRITVNACIDCARRHGRRHTSVADPEAVADTVADLRIDVASEAVKKAEHEMVRDAVARLPDRYRTIVVLHYYEGLGYTEIAEIAGITPRAVETRLYRARGLLRDSLEGSFP